MKEIYIDASELTKTLELSPNGYSFGYVVKHKNSYEEDPFVLSLKENKINKWYRNNNYILFISNDGELFRLFIENKYCFYGDIESYIRKILNSLNIKEIKFSDYLPKHDPYDYKYWAYLLLPDYYDVNQLDKIHIASIMKELYKVTGIGHIKNLQDKFNIKHYLNLNDINKFITEFDNLNNKFMESIMTIINDAMNNKIIKDYLDAYCKLHLNDGIFLGSYILNTENYNNPNSKDKKLFDRVHLSFAIKSDRGKVREYIKNSNFREEILRPIFNYNMKGYTNLMKMYGATITKYDRLVCSFCFKDEVEKRLPGRD